MVIVLLRFWPLAGEGLDTTGVGLGCGDVGQKEKFGFSSTGTDVIGGEC